MPIAPGSKESYIGVFLEDILYGVYLSVFFESCLLMWRKQQERNAKNTYLLVTISLMFLFITVRCVLDNVRCIIALDNTGLDFGPPNTTLGIFRTFIVWNRNWFVIILPSMLFVGNVGTATWLIVAFIKYDPTTKSIFFLTQPITSFLALSLCTNLLCTGLISFRIFYVRRKVAALLSGRSDVTKFISVIIESAAIYTLLLTASLITNSEGSYVNYILFNCTPPTIVCDSLLLINLLVLRTNREHLTGAKFSYIIIRVRRGTSYGESTAASTTLNSRGRQSSPTFELGSNCNTRSGSKSDVQVQVRLERVAHVDTASNHYESKYSGVAGV
ncbi:hypothetical protein C8R44DRAFT_882734 [Mycena epipterygia]|nr:hypothetical protein C8R44DRAFT_882734 [Mycena epipterygia]